jgi:hypothetical protein
MVQDSPVDALSDDLLSQALARAKARSAEIDEQLGQLTSERRAVRREVELLEELLAVRRGEAVQSSSSREAIDGGGKRIAQRRKGGTHPVVVAAIAELEKTRRPLHISELMLALQDQGVSIPGSGQQANLIAHLTRESQIVRPSRGMYALASWGIEEKPKVRPAVRRRVRGKSKSATRRSE